MHEHDYSPLFHTNGQALHAVIQSVLVVTIDGYAPIEELPGGKASWTWPTYPPAVPTA